MKKFILLLITTLILGGLFAVPLYEGFEGTTCPATGWTITYANQSFPSGNTMTHSTTYSYAGARSFRFSSFSSGAPYDQYLITPELDVTAGDQTVSFWYRKHSSGSETFRVGWSSTGTEVTDFTWTTDITDASTTWQQYIKTDLPVGTKYVAIHYKSSYAYYLYIDEFVGPNVNVAPEPSSHVTGFTATPDYFNVKLDWTGSTGTQLPHRYLIQAIKVGAGSYAAVADGTPVADDTDWSDGNAAVNVAHVVGANTYTFTGLNPITAYEFKIWPYTNSGTDIDFKVDAPIPTINATTLDPTIYAADLPYLQNFDGVTAPALPAGWSKQVSSTSSYAAVETYTSGTPNSAPNHARLANSGDSAADLVLISPLIDPNLSSLKVKFWAKGGTNYTLQVGTMDGAGSRAVFTNVETINLTSTYTEYSVSFIGYTGTDQHIAFKHGLGSTYRTIYIDDVTIELLPTSGVLQVTPDPVECGNGYVGFEKDVMVTLANIGGAPFDISAGGITLSDYTNFQLDNLPTLPYTLQPNTSVQITVVFNPTVTGDLTTNLLINDTRQASSIVVNGTGVQPLVGEICENPYLATLPLVDYAGTTAGYANDYTSEMFTGLGNTNYVRGQDWVAKISIPGNGLLDISLADQTGYSSQWMGVFLVNTIPSVANPAAVLAQDYGSAAPLDITDVVVSAGDYYVIVDNYPSPYDVYFVLNISFEPVTSAPNPATLVSPANGATDVPLTQTLNWSSGGGFVEGYRLSFGTVTPYTTIVNNVDLGMDTTYTPTLNYSTEYWWTVTPYNTDFGDASPITEWTFTTRDDPTIYAPWLEDFGSTGATFPPANWTRGNGLLADPSNITSGSYWVRDDWLNDTPVDPVNYAAKMNVYSTNRGGWLITPPIQMPGTGYQLELDIGLTDYGAHAAPDTPTDDRFIILIGDGNSWAPANILREWNNTGSDYVYDEIPYTGEHVIIPIDSYTGIQYIAFYGESIASGGDNDLFVDNVSIRLAGQAPDHVTLLAPADLSNTVDPGNCVLSWQDAVGGGYPEWYEIYVGSELIDPTNDYYGEYTYESTTNSLDLIAQGDIDLGFNTTWYWAVLPYNTAGNPDPTGMTVFRFTTLPDPTIVVLPHEEYFDDVTAPALPYGWSAYVNSSTTGALVATYNSSTYAQSAPNSVRLYNSTDASADLRLITPPIDASIPLNTIKLKFYARSSSAGYPLLIGTVNAPDSTGTFTQIASIDLTSTKTEYIYSLEDYVGTDQYICFKHGMGGTYRGLYVDNVQLIELLANDLAATAITGPSYLEAGETYEFTITVSNEGTADQNSYAVNLKEGTNTVATLNVSTPLASGASAQHTLSWTPTNGGAYTLSGQVVLTGDMNNTNDVTTSNRVYVIDNTVDLVYVGDDATTSSSNYLPVDMYYRNGVTEELYFTDEMHLQSGTITAIVYKNNFQNDRQDKAIKIWMAHTDVADLSGGWLPADNYTLVFDGLVDFPSGVNYVAIPLDTPFAYTGGTLATRVHRVFDSGSLSSSDKFFYTTNADHSTRSRYTRSDTEYGDQIPPTGTSYTLNYFPNTIFVTQNAVFDPQAVLSGHVYDSVTSAPIEGAMISLTERAVTYTDVNGYYEFVYWDSTFVDLTCSATDYYSSTVTGISFEPGTPATQNFNLQPLPSLTVSGVVTANDYPAGLAGALVELFGYHDYSTITDANGAFSIANVKGRADTLSYSWVVSKEGYQSEIGAFDAITTDINLGTINLTEYLWTPYNLVASHEGNDARLNWDPAEQPDFLFFDFEQNDGGFTVENNPSPGWEWGTSSYSGAHSGTKVWGTVLEGNYANSATYDLISPLSYPIESGGYLTFWHRYNFEFYTTPTYYDGGIVQISTDDGATWSTITPVGGYPCTSSSSLGYIPMYGGEQLEWTQASFDLSEYVGQTVRFKWRLLSESSVNREGWYVDDVLIGVPTAKTAMRSSNSRSDGRALLNYSVYRFPVAEEETPANWTLLSNNCATETYLDTGFSALSSGAYKWAVKANYSGSLESTAIISNPLGIFGTPQNVVATTTADGNVNLGWTAEPGASYYVIYGSHDPYGTYTILGYSATNSYDYVVGTDPFHFFKIAAADGVMPTPAPPAKTK